MPPHTAARQTNQPRPAILHVPSRDMSAVVVCVGAGSRFEPAQANGLAHLLEHGVFLGAGSRDYRSIRSTIDRLGGDISAETSEEVIVYWGSVNDPRDFPECLDLVADLVLAPTFDEDSLRKEIGTVVQEISGAGDDVFQTVIEGTKKLLWPTQSVGRPVGGSERTLRRLNARTCRDFWEQTHRGGRMLVLVVGSAADSKRARKRFNAELAAGPIAISTGHERSGRPELKRFQAKPMAGNFSRLCFGLPAFGWSDERIAALTLLNGLLGRDETSHLWDAIRGQGLSYSTESFLDCFSDSGWLGIVTDAPVAATGEVVGIVYQEVASFARQFKEEEFEEARTGHIARLRNDEQNAPVEWAKYQAIHAYFRGHVPTVDDLVKETQDVTLAQARAVAEDIFRPERLVLTVGGPRLSLRDAWAAFESRVAAG